MFQFNFDATDNGQSNNENLIDDSVVEASIYDKCVEVIPSEEQLNLTQSTWNGKLNTTKFKNNHQITHISVDKLLIDRLSEDAEEIKSAEQNDSDVVPGVYEGGAKVWECTQDLGDYLTILNADGCAVIDEFVDKSVLDLGCGAGLLGILALKIGSSTVHFQDYNAAVLQHITIPNILLSMDNERSQRHQIIDSSKLYSGDWNNYVAFTKDSGKFDRILTSETIYNPKNYAKIINVLKQKLKADGICYLAAKSHYFGVGGSLRQFELALRDDSTFYSEIVFACHENVSREILRITYKMR